MNNHKTLAQMIEPALDRALTAARQAGRREAEQLPPCTIRLELSHSDAVKIVEGLLVCADDPGLVFNKDEQSRFDHLANTIANLLPSNAFRQPEHRLEQSTLATGGRR